MCYPYFRQQILENDIKINRICPKCKLSLGINKFCNMCSYIPLKKDSEQTKRVRQVTAGGDVKMKYLRNKILMLFHKHIYLVQFFETTNETYTVKCKLCDKRKVVSN